MGQNVEVTGYRQKVGQRREIILSWYDNMRSWVTTEVWEEHIKFFK